MGKKRESVKPVRALPRRRAEGFADLLDMEMASGARLRGQRKVLVSVAEGFRMPFALRIQDAMVLDPQPEDRCEADAAVILQGPGSFGLLLGWAVKNRCYYAYPVDMRQLPFKAEQGSFFKKCNVASLDALEILLKPAIRATFEIPGTQEMWSEVVV